MSVSSFNPNAGAPTLNAPALNVPALPAPAANTAGYAADSFASSLPPAANTAPATYNAPAANAAAPAPTPVAPKSGGGGIFGMLAAAAVGGLGALKFLVPKFAPALLKNASALRSFGIFGAGAAIAVLGYSFLKNKLMGGASAQAQAQQIPPEVLAQIKQLLQQGVPPQALAQEGVPVEVLRQLGAQI